MNKCRYLKLLPINILLLVILVLSGCSPSTLRQTIQADGSGGIPVSGPGDLYCLSVLLNQQLLDGAAVSQVSMTVSADSIEDLKQGKTDIAFLGREPTDDELQGLKDYVIAYDAICIILDDTSFVGGIIYQGGLPQYKNTGLQELTMDDLEAIVSGNGWLWDGGYYSVNNTVTSQSEDVSEVDWALKPKQINLFCYFPVGKFDTQSVLYQSMGLDENSLLEPRTSFTSPRYDKEEEVLSYEYNSSYYSFENGLQGFSFKLGFASRRVMTIAQYHIPVNVLAIDGIDPLASPQSVYDGTYKLSREIHLLIRDDSSSEVIQIAQYLESEAGQQALAEAGYLPVLPQ